MRSWHSQMLSFQASERPLKQINRGKRLLLREEIYIMHTLGFARMRCKFYASFPPILNRLRNVKSESSLMCTSKNAGVGYQNSLTDTSPVFQTDTRRQKL